jgi:hypothetical protein
VLLAVPADQVAGREDPQEMRIHDGGARPLEQPAAANRGWRTSSYSNNGGDTCVEVGTWRTSSYSNNGGATCVEVGTAIAGVLVRDTADRASATLAVPAAAWRWRADIQSPPPLLSAPVTLPYPAVHPAARGTEFPP